MRDLILSHTVLCQRLSVPAVRLAALPGRLAPASDFQLFGHERAVQPGGECAQLHIQQHRQRQRPDAALAEQLSVSARQRRWRPVMSAGWIHAFLSVL